MITSRYAFTLRVADPAGNLIYEGEVREFGSMYEDVLWRAVLAGDLPNDGTLPAAALEPVGEGERVHGFRLTLNGVSRQYPLFVISNRVSQIVAQAKAAIPADAPPSDGSFTWEVIARQSAGAPRPRRARVIREPYPILERLPVPIAFGAREPLMLSLRVAVLLRTVAAASPNCERAHLLADWVVKGSGSVVVVADRAYPVENGVSATQVRIDFSPASFPSALRELSRSGEGRTPVGWAHNHPPPCGGPCPADPPACDADSVFFSVDDRQVHASYFRAPYMVAVVSGKGTGRRVDDPVQRAWGWADGSIREIGFATFREEEDE